MPVCERCQKTGNSESCKYVPYDDDETISRTSTLNTPLSPKTSRGVLKATISTSQTFPTPSSKGMSGMTPQPYAAAGSDRETVGGNNINFSTMGSITDTNLQRQMAKLSPPNSTRNNAKVHEVALTFNRSRAIALLEFAAQMLEDRLMHLGELFHPFWHTVGALSLAYPRRDGPGTEQRYALQAVHRIQKITEKAMQLQRPRANAQSAVVSQEASSGFTQPAISGFTGLPSPLDMSDVHFDIEGFGFPDFWGMGGLPDFDF